MNNNANAQDVLWITAFLFATALILFIINFSGTSISTHLSNHSQINGTLAQSPIDNIQNHVNKFDMVIFMVFMGLILGMIITSWFVAGHPMFMFIYFIVIVIGAIISMGLSNAWGSVSEASIFGSTISQFPITNHIMGLLPMYVVVIGFIGITIMFAKPFMSDME